MYNAELYIEETINSVLNQSYQNFELLIIDDGSNDASANICEKISAKDERVRIIREKNGGVSSARNCGIANAKWEWILFIDSDDIVDNDYVQSFIPFMRKNSLAQHAGCKISHLDKKQEIYHIASTKSNEESKGFIQLYSKNLLYSSVWGKLFNKSIIIDNNIRFNEEINNGEDRLFVSDYLLCPEINSIDIIPKMSYNYILHNGSITHSDIDIESYCLSNVYHFHQFKLLVSKFIVSDNDFISRNMSIMKKKLYDGLLLLIRSDIKEEKKKDIYSKMYNCFEQLKPFHTNKKLDLIFQYYPFSVGISLIKLVDKLK